MWKFVALAMMVVPQALTQVSITTHHSDIARTGTNLSETSLNTSNVNPGQFGKLFSYSVDGSVYAQPLYVSSVQVSGLGTHNVVYLATMNNSIYAYDADSNTGTNASPLWTRNYNDAANGVTPVPSTDVQTATDIIGPIGILSTPVIDLTTQVMYFVVRTKENGAYFQRLHAVDIRSGSEMANSPTTITASVVNSSHATVTFDPKIQNQRAALALANGFVYIAWASHNDIGAYHGWVMAYTAYSSGGTGGLQQSSVFNNTPDGAEGGIWQGGSAPAIDSAGDLYIGAGNGQWDGNTGFGQTVVKLSPTLQVLDYFTSSAWQTESNQDLDFASGGITLLPGTGLMVETSKTGTLYLLSTQNMGHLAAGNTQIPQSFVAGGGHIHSGPVYWNSPSHGPLLYIWSETDFLKAYHFNSTTFDTTPLMTSTFQDPPGMPGGFMALSANGNVAGSAILWVNMPYSGDANHQTVSGVLRAFDANDLTKELWNSHTQLARDDFGNFAKFSPPIVANGKVYVSTFSNQVAVYGLLATGTPGVFESLSPSTLALNPGTSGSLMANVSSSGTLASSISWSAANVPSGVSVQFSPLSVNTLGSSTVTVTASGAALAGTYPINIIATSGSYSASQPLTLTIASVSSTSIQINAGGGAAGAFIADADFSGGSPASTSNTIDTSAVTNPAPQSVYQSERYGVFTYTISTLAPSSQYTVRLHFAEFYYGAAGQRQFDVAINGTSVLKNFDIVSAAGGANKAIVRQFTATANGSGQIVIAFTNGPADNPKVSGIEVIPGGTVIPPSSIQIDSGGGTAGTFLADTDFSGGTAAATTNMIDTSAVTSPAPQSVYQSERYGVFAYTIPTLIAGGQYTVRLHFAEFYFVATGKRLFNVAINGSSVLQNFDIVAAAGGANKAIVRQFNATANGSGQILIAFTNGAADNPKVSGIEVVPGTTAPPPPTSVQIDAGGGTAGTFLADVDYSGGNAASTNNIIDTSAVSNPAPQAVYQTERWGVFTYTIPNLRPAAQYTVRLHFAEIYYTTPGRRLFNVAINGSSVLQNFDIVAAAGAANKAIVQQFNATADSGGDITVAFTNGAADNPKVSGIELIPGATVIPPTSVQIDSGGGATGAFLADLDYSGGTAAATTNMIDTSAVTNPAPQSVYQSERYGVFTYTIPTLTAGSQYTVRLHFAEFYFLATGKRLFNVAINGSSVLQNFDIVAAAGSANKAVVRQFNAIANTSGQIVISFTNGAADNPKVSGIEVIPGSTTPPPTSVQIDSGGGTSGTFVADAYYAGGTAASTTNTIDTSAVSNPAPQAVYQTERWGVFTYTIPNLTPATQYTVRLHFAEIYYTTPGRRLFNVAINGSSVLQNFDVEAAAGGANKAIVRQFTATANSSGQITIAFTNGTTDNPKVSGIEIQ